MFKCIARHIKKSQQLYQRHVSALRTNATNACHFLDAIKSPSTYPCQWVGQSVIHSFRLEIAIASPSFASLFTNLKLVKGKVSLRKADEKIQAIANQVQLHLYLHVCKDRNLKEGERTSQVLQTI